VIIMDKGGMFEMKVKTALCSVAVTVLAAFASRGETLGFWNFGDGTVGQAAAYGTVPNQVADGPVSLTLAVAGTMSSGAIYMSNRLPGERSLYSDLTMTKRIAVLNSALLLSVKDPSTTQAAQNWGNSHYLRIPEFGKELLGKDFTFEIITAQPQFNGYTGGDNNGRQCSTVVAISAPGNAGPGFWITSYNRGTIYYKGTTAKQRLSNGWFNYVSNRGTSWFNENYTWHHLAFVYTASSKTMNVIKDYTESTATLTLTADGANGLPMDADSFLQISGPIASSGDCSLGTPNLYVAAVRLSSGALDYKKFMTLSKGPEAYADDPVVGWWRMENGTLGANLASVPNEKGALTICDVDTKLVPDAASTYQKHAGVSAVYAAPWKNHVCEGVDRENGIPNLMGVAASQFLEAKNGLRVCVPRVPDIGIPGSFTCECFVRKDLEATTSGDGNARPCLMGTPSWGVWDNADFWLAFVYNKTTDGANPTLCRPQRTMAPQIPADHKWHHLAIVFNRPAADQPKTLSLYFDYKLVNNGTVNFAANEDLEWNSSGKLTCAGSAGAVQGGDSWWGAVDEIRFTRQALTPDKFLRSYSDLGLIITVE
ncbi:MAG: hypothetical protein KBT68_12285, partial [bacterium]|nr:hypothetical protein [Candidatus Colisoma equi]